MDDSPQRDPETFLSLLKYSIDKVRFNWLQSFCFNLRNTKLFNMSSEKLIPTLRNSVGTSYGCSVFGNHLSLKWGIPTDFTLRFLAQSLLVLLRSEEKATSPTHLLLISRLKTIEEQVFLLFTRLALVTYIWNKFSTIFAAFIARNHDDRPFPKLNLNPLFCN